MTREEAETVLAEAGKASDESFPLFEASLACAVHEDPSRDPPASWRGRPPTAWPSTSPPLPSTRPWPRPWPGTCG